MLFLFPVSYFFSQPFCQHARACGREVNRAVCKFIKWNNVPKIKIGPAKFFCAGGHLFAVLVICPARVKRVVANIAIFAAALRHWLVHDEQRCAFALRQFRAGVQHTKRQGATPKAGG